MVLVFGVILMQQDRTCFTSAVKSIAERSTLVLYLLYGFVIPLIALYVSRIPVEYILYASIALLISNLCCPLAVVLIMCRLFALPPSTKLLLPWGYTGGILVSFSTSLNFWTGAEPGLNLLREILLLVSVVYSVIIILAIVIPYRCLPKCLRGVEKACKLCEETVDLRSVASAGGLRLETVYPEPSWGGLWRSTAVVNFVYLAPLFASVYAVAPDMLLPTTLAGVAVAVVFTAVRTAASRRFGVPLCFRYASAPVQLAFLTLLVLDLGGVLRGAVIPSGSGLGAVAILATELSVAHIAMLIIDVYTAVGRRGRHWRFFGMCMGEMPRIRILGKDSTRNG